MKLPRNERAPIAREGARPRAPRRRVSTPRCTFVLDYKTCSASVRIPRPRDPLSPKPSTFCNRGRKYTFGLRHVLAARGDARPPRIAPAHDTGAGFRGYTP
jgi:hypothetical protein